MRPTIEQTIVPSESPDDTSRLQTVTGYALQNDTTSKGLGEVTKSITVNTFPNSESIALFLNLRNDNHIRELQTTLQEAGFESTSERTASALKLKISSSTNDRSKPAMVKLAKTLGKAPARIGGISEDLASQIIDAELKRTGVSASQAGLLQLEVKDLPATHITRHSKDPLYLDADITHPFSPVTYLSERSNTPTGGEAVRTTRIGFRDGKDATRIKEALGKSGVVFNAPLDKGKACDISAQAPISTVAETLSQHHILPEAIAEEIQAKIIAMKTEQRIGGGRSSPSQGATR